MAGEIYADAKVFKTTRRIPKGKICLRPAALAPEGECEDGLSQMIVEIEGQHYLIKWDSTTPPQPGGRHR